MKRNYPVIGALKKPSKALKLCESPMVCAKSIAVQIVFETIEPELI
jgi:hypothetical protein